MRDGALCCFLVRNSIGVGEVEGDTSNEMMTDYRFNTLLINDGVRCRHFQLYAQRMKVVLSLP